MKRLKHITLILPAFILAVAFTSVENRTVEPIAWKVDKVHSSIKFQVRHFFTPVEGSFTDYKGDIHFSPEDLSASKINVEIPISSINTNNEKRDGHLMSPDFFHAEKYPLMSFTSETIKKGRKKNEYIAEGTITIRGVEKNFSLPFNVLGIQDHPMKEGTKLAGIKSEFTIDRTEFNVGVNDWAATTVIGDEVTVSLLLELNSI